MFRILCGKLFYTKPITRYCNSRYIMKLKALKQMGVYYYYDKKHNKKHLPQMDKKGM